VASDPLPEMIMVRRLDKTLVDYLVIAVSPALIMTLIGSLVFFLLEVAYRGEYGIRLNFIFALFVFAAVLVARIAIEEGRERAYLFAIPLGIVAFLALQKFVQFQGGGLGGLSWAINLALIALVLWCADKLTWDCTLIDETQRDSGRGLLQLVGFDKPPAAKQEPQAGEPSKPEGVTSPAAKPASWWERYHQRRRRPHALGVWVVYFSLAALPLFGIGQLLTAPAQRQDVFCLLLVYVASGLGLLLTTSFLGLRRHLRQRRVEMPAVMASVWLVIGCALIVAVLIFAALLPRPGAEYAATRAAPVIGSPRQDPSPHAVGNRGVEADDGELHSAESDRQSEASPSKGHPEDAAANGQKSDEREENDKSKTRPPSEGSPSPSDRDQEPENTPQQPDAESEVRPQGHRQTDQSPSGQGAADETEPSKPGTQSAEGTDRRLVPARRPDSQRVSLPDDTVQSVGRTLAILLKWVFYIAVALIGIYWLWRRRAEVLAALQGLLSAWHGFWQNLFGRRRKEADEAAGSEGGPKQPLPRPFADFADPFATGTAGRYSPDELVRYSFEALEAWARERGCPRQPEQTPHEFAQNVGKHAASLARDARILAELYCRVAYAPGKPFAAASSCRYDDWGQQQTCPAASVPTADWELPPTSVDSLRELWRQLRSAASRQRDMERGCVDGRHARIPNS
jgi:hypothetical protein